MLATAGEHSSREDANSSNTGKRSKLDILAEVAKPASPKPKPSVEQKKIAESIAKELSHWEKVVFSFDMERDPGRSASSSGQRSNEQDNTNPRRQAPASSRSSSSSGAYPSQSFPPGAQGTAFPPFSQHPQLSGQQQQYHHQMGAPGLGGLDPYVLQQLAAISALSGSPPQGSHPSQSDPFASLRQTQSTSHHSGSSSDPFSNLPRGFPTGLPSSSHASSSNLPLPQGIPNPALLNSPAGLQWLAHMQAMGQQHPQQPPHLPSLLQGYSGQEQRQGQQRPIARHTFPGGAHTSQTQTPGAGPSRARGSVASSSSGGSSRAASASSPSPVSPASATPRAQQDFDEVAIAEDKRRRNTAASARFRIKKKHKTMALERSVVELEARADDLEREAADLRRENGWLKEMLIMKGRRARVAALEAAEEDDEENISEGSEEEENEADDAETPTPDPKSAGKGKGKQKEK